MAPRPIQLRRGDVFAAAQEVALSEAKPSRAKVASRLGLVESTFNKALRREGWLDDLDAILRPPVEAGPELPQAGVSETEDGSVVFASDPRNNPPAPWKPDEVMRAHGRDPADFIIVRERYNRWGDPAEPMHQLRFDAIPRASIVRPADPTDWTPPPKPSKRPANGTSRSVVICGDHHCPHEDRTLHDLFLAWLADERPDEGVILGDIMDLSSVSRHRRGKRMKPADVQACIDAAFRVLRDYREASPETKWTLLPGNHDDRLDHYQIDNAPELYEVAPADEQTPALSVRRLLHLDALGIDLITDDHNRAKYLLGRKLTLRHGYLSGKNASQNMLAKVTRSTVQGHTHRLRLIYKTDHDEHDEEQPTTTRLAAEAGCMAEIKDSLYYGDEEDWQQGFLLAHLWPDDDFTLVPVPYVPGRLLAPNGKRYGV